MIELLRLKSCHQRSLGCFRKKLLPTGVDHDWSKATNCVVKRYMDNVPNKTLYDDVRLQMDTKLWSEEYNKHHPPKKVSKLDYKFFIFWIAVNNDQKSFADLFLSNESIRKNF